MAFVITARRTVLIPPEVRGMEIFYSRGILVNLFLFCMRARNMVSDFPVIAHDYNSALSLRTSSIAAVSGLLVTTICFFSL